MFEFRIGDQGREWKKQQIVVSAPFTSRDHTFNLDFVGVRGDGIDSDMAIDDIRVEERQCPNVPDVLSLIVNPDGNWRNPLKPPQ